MDKEYFASINTVSKDLNLPAHTLRYWEKQFPTIVRPVLGTGGRRYYRPETVARLKTIQDLLYNRGMTIAGVKKLIRSGDFLANNIEPWRTNAVAPNPMTDTPSDTDDFAVSDFRDKTQPCATLDTTKVELAIGLLTQARDLLK